MMHCLPLLLINKSIVSVLFCTVSTREDISMSYVPCVVCSCVCGFLLCFRLCARMHTCCVMKHSRKPSDKNDCAHTDTIQSEVNGINMYENGHGKERGDSFVLFFFTF